MRIASPVRRALCVAAAVACITACATRAPRTAPDAGKITVGVTTEGPGASGLSFTVEIEPAGVQGSVKADAGVFTASNVPAGEHVVRLTGVPARCRVDGRSERNIRLAAQRSAAVRFSVVCK